MAAPYHDGLDDFDREVLGHDAAGFHSQRLNYVADHRRTLGFDPRLNAAPHSNPPEEYDTYYDAILTPHSSLELEAPSKATLPLTSQQLRPRNNILRGEPAHLLGGLAHMMHGGTTQQQSAPYGRASQRNGPSTNDFQGPASSSPTTRLSIRKQQNEPVLPRLTQPSSNLSSSPEHPTRNRQPDASHSTPVIHGIPLVSLRQALPDKFRAIFPYEYFNAVQSKCFGVVYGTNDNVVVAAPTGSGKTAILELAICKLALDRGNENFKIVYQAPTKALCAEKARDWEKKFSHMNLKCAELTGDTSQAEMRRVGDASIIVTTPEKWDSITRKWQDHRRLLQMVELFLIDEVHILKDGRGATLEAVVSRMKTIGANVRFVALSATVPNSDDIARWLGRNHTSQQLPAHRETFGEEFRPVKLQKFVYGFDSKCNEYIFDKFLDQKLPGLLARHARKKPILVFCFTRKSCESTAAVLADFASGRQDVDKLWPVPSQRVPVLNRDLQEIVKFGVAFHHAGLDAQDRSAVEQHFLRGRLGVICCTSTLAVGINLPCHTVVLKGTVGFTDERLEEYSDLEVMQMLGRAGRPQFDDSATAIILTRAANKERYEKMVSGQEILESTLHLNLIEHLNSEICLGTITDLASAKTWLGGTFLSVRLRRNPGYYQLTGGTVSPSQIDDKLEEICERDIKQLQEARLVTHDNAFRCTEYGRAMSKYMVEFNTMKLLLQIPWAAGMEVLITILSQATEFREFRFKPAERPLFREINQSPLTMYPIKEAVSQTRHKVSLMVQTHLGCVQYPDSGEAAKVRRQLMMEKKLVFERLNRLVRAVIDCKGHDRDSVGTRTALELARALAAGSWEGRATQLTQVPNIGPVGMRKLASKDIRTVLDLADRDYDEIERLMSRQPPFGKNLQAHLDKFPRLNVDAAIVGQKMQPSSPEPVLVHVKATLRYLNRKGLPHWLNRVPALTFLAETRDGVLVYFWRGSMRNLDRDSGFELRFSVGLRDSHDYITCHFSCEEIVGTIVSKTLKHTLPASGFPSQPVSAMARSTQRGAPGSQDYLDNDGIEDSDLIRAAEEAQFNASVPKSAEPTAPFDNEEYPCVEELLGAGIAEGPPTNNSFSNKPKDSRNAAGTGRTEDGQAEYREPVRLPNGKWQCNHPCTGNAPTRSGKPCNHRCCKEGLDKPRRRPLQRHKRKIEEPTEESVSDTAASGPSQARLSRPSQTRSDSRAQPQAKRRKVQTPWSLDGGRLDSPSQRPVTDPKAGWEHLDLDAMDLECIDLSWTDDEDDGVDKLPKAASSTRPASGVDVSTAATADYRGRNRERAHNGLQQNAAAAAMQRRVSPPPCGVSQDRGAVPAESSITQDDYFDDDDMSLFDEPSFSRSLAKLTDTATAFRPGASDEMLSQGISMDIDGADSTERVVSQGQGDAKTSAATPGATTQRGNGTSPSSADTLPNMSSDNTPNSSALTRPVVPRGLESEVATETVDGSTSAKRLGGNPDEPAWVADFDPEFVDMFRGYVTFV